MAVVRWSNGISGALLVVVALAFLAFLPEDIADYAREPEDVWGSGISIIILGLVAALCFANATNPAPLPQWRIIANWAVVIVMTVLIVLSAIIAWDLAGVLLFALCALGPAAALVGGRQTSRVQRS